jgi:hypothetical protein
MGEIQRRWRGDGGEIQGRWRGDTGEIHGRQRGDTGWKASWPLSLSSAGGEGGLITRGAASFGVITRGAASLGSGLGGGFDGSG